MFDKEEYWANRKDGKRGQGEPTTAPELAVWTKEDHEEGRCGVEQIGKTRTSGVSMYAMGDKPPRAVTRKMKRGKVVDRNFTKRGYEYGVPIDSKKYRDVKRAQRKAIREHPELFSKDTEEMRRHKQRFPAGVKLKNL
jgi:hypothetical protein